MTSATFRAVLQALADAWRDRRYEDAARYVAPAVRYVDPLHYAIEGRQALRAFWSDDGGHPQITVWRHILFDEPAQIGAAEYTYRGTYQYHGVVLVRLENDLITRWREYQHVSDLEWAAFFKGASF